MTKISLSHSFIHSFNQSEHFNTETSGIDTLLWKKTTKHTLGHVMYLYPQFIFKGNFNRIAVNAFLLASDHELKHDDDVTLLFVQLI